MSEWRCGCGELNPAGRRDCGNCGAQEAVHSDPLFPTQEARVAVVIQRIADANATWDGVRVSFQEGQALTARLAALERERDALVNRLDGVTCPVCEQGIKGHAPDCPHWNDADLRAEAAEARLQAVREYAASKRGHVHFAWATHILSLLDAAPEVKP